jgi:5-methylcytosine-specific restriction enzyme A
MKSCLITFKPSSESPERGWPLEDFQKLVRRYLRDGGVEDKWRFHNRSEVSSGDRVFLLLQGKNGPAIIGYGSVARTSAEDKADGRAVVRFDALSDPTKQVLANEEDVRAIDGAQSLWRTQASGVRIPDAVALELEKLVVGRARKARDEVSASNPDWTRDELILALNVYLRHRPNLPGKGSPEIIELSERLNRLGEKLFSPTDRASTFRNENGVYMKLMNFRRLDPQYTVEGKTGLSRGAKAEEEVWAEFSEDTERCRNVADAIIATLESPDIVSPWEADLDDGVQEAAEGRLLTRTHLARERNRTLVESKRKQAMKKYGRLACEACGFDFGVAYGERGNGFIECHHTKGVATLLPGQKTHLDDLALVCANCHRVIHRAKPWLTVTQLQVLIQRAKSGSSKTEV